MDNLALLSDYLSTYEGRDKFLKTLSYAAKLSSGIPFSEETAGKFQKFGSEMSDCRVVLRLLDDIPSWHNVLTIDWRRKEPNQMIRLVELTQIVLDVIYSPIESICWAGEHKFISINAEKWEIASTWFWIIAIYLSLIRVALDKVVVLRRSEVLSCIRLVLDLSYAVSYLPSGTLWGGRLKTWQVGALGTISSLIGLYQALSKRAKHAKSS